MKPEPQVFFLRRKDFYFFLGGGVTHANGLKNNKADTCEWT
jgi:hypothetical protein